MNVSPDVKISISNYIIIDNDYNINNSNGRVTSFGLVCYVFDSHLMFTFNVHI